MSTNPNIERLINEYGDSIFRMCFLYLRDHDLAEDAVQETFIKAMNHYERFQGNSEEKTWLIRIAINTCKNMMRTRWFHHLPLPNTMDEPSVDSHDEAIVTKLTFSHAIMKLPPKEREVTILYYYQELKVKEIAALLGISETAVLQRLRRSRLKLKESLKMEGFDYE